MIRICKYCGAEYVGAPGSTACADCAARVKKSVIRSRTCRQCGVAFPGGPRAFYCPNCRAERERESAKRYQARGAQRPLGSIDRCSICGREYVVNGSRQKYCPNCAAEAIRAVDRAQSAAWQRDNQPPEKRRDERKACAAQIHCAICGKPFVPSSPATTCSAECSAALAKRAQDAFESAHHDERRQRNRDNRKAREATMSPDEYRAYRDRLNAKARENYKRRRSPDE